MLETHKNAVCLAAAGRRCYYTIAYRSIDRAWPAWCVPTCKTVKPRSRSLPGAADIQHRLFLLSLHGLTAAKIPPNISSALDLGCGTGSWTVAFAAVHPSCSVLGVDLTPPYIPSPPSNCHFIAANAEEPWHFGTERFDFIYARFLTAGIKDWPRLWVKFWDHLNPGGIVEVSEAQIPPLSYSGATPGTSPYLKFVDALLNGWLKAGIVANQPHEEHLRRQGFRLVEERTVEWPLGNWCRTETGEALGEMAMENMRTVTQVPGTWKLMRMATDCDEEEARKICSDARRDLDENWRERRFSFRV